MHNEAAIDQWRALRVGLFIHWGPSAGRALPQSHSHARQSVLNPHGSVPAAVYDQFYLEFNPTAYDPDGWLQLAYAAGMRYTVFVAKHHDGFCLFDSAATAYSIMATPYGKDVAALFAAACRRQGLALGWQISPKDWKHPDFSTADHARYNDFYTAIMAELATKYGPIAVMWFDGIDPVGPDQWQDAPEQIATMLRHHNPQIVLSNHGGCTPDFISFETMVGPFDRANPWEMCEAINPSGWVFNQPMPTYPLRKLLRNLIYTVARDGNYLLDVGPMPNGQLYGPDAERLAELATWMHDHAEGIHGTRGGPYRDGDWGGATCKGNSIYLFLTDRVGTHLTLPALAAEVRTVQRLDGGPLEWQVDATALHLSLPDRATTERPIFVGLKVELDRPAFALPLIDGQPNLAATARLTPSSIRDNDDQRWGPQNLFDNNGATAWDSARTETSSSLDLDLGQVTRLGSAALAQRAVPDGYNGWFHYCLKVRSHAAADWQTVIEAHNCLGCPPILEFAPIDAHYVQLEIHKSGKQQPIQLAEFRLFAALEE